MTIDLTPDVREYVIYQGGDPERLADLNRAVRIAESEAAAQDGARRLGDDDMSAAITAAREAFDAAVDVAAERALSIKYRHIGLRRYRELVAEHPPRMVDSEPDEEGVTKKVIHEDDQLLKVNTTTFPMRLLTYRDDADDALRTIVEPDFSSKADCQRFLEDRLSEGQFEELSMQVYLLNQGGSASPKSLRYSATTQSSDET